MNVSGTDASQRQLVSQGEVASATAGKETAPGRKLQSAGTELVPMERPGTVGKASSTVMPTETTPPAERPTWLTKLKKVGVGVAIVVGSVVTGTALGSIPVIGLTVVKGFAWMTMMPTGSGGIVIGAGPTVVGAAIGLWLGVRSAVKGNAANQA